MTERVCLALIFAAAPLLPAADWLQFRGSDSSAVAAEQDVPLSWDEERNVAWKAALPGRGLSSPIVIGDRLVVTASSGYRQDRLHVLCFDQRSGKRLWTRQFWATGHTRCHPKTSMAAPTPASDGERIFAFYSSNDVYCLDLDGNLLWVRGLTHDYPNASNSVGMSSSPLVIGDTLVVQVENDSDSFAAGLDVTSGANRWKIARPYRVNWTSPVRLSGASDGAAVLILQSTEKLSGHDPSTGNELWAHEAACGAIPSSTVSGEVVYVPAAGTTALRPRAGKPPEVLWQSKRLRLTTPSAVVHGDRYLVVSGSILKCADVKSGEIIWQLRLEGPISSSPVVVGEHLYVFNEKGTAHVVALGDEGKLVATSDLNETILCTPAIAHGALFVRSDSHLWKIGGS